MISLDEAIKRAEEVAEVHRSNARTYEDMMVFKQSTKCNTQAGYYEELMKECIECANEHQQFAEWLKELKQLREETKGIPVSERPPENGKEVFIYMDQSPYLATYEDGEWQTDTFTIDPEYEPTEWWELPKPYKAES